MKKFAAAVMAAGALTMLAGCSKPAEGEVHDALVEIYTSQGASQEDAEAFADCAAPKMHEDVSRSGLNALIEDGIDAKGDDDDYDAITKIAADCATEVTGS